MMDRYYPSQPSFSKPRVPYGSKGPAKASTSTILESTKRPREAQPASYFPVSSGPLHGNTYKANTSLHPSTFDQDLPSPVGDSPPVEPSLFAYSSSRRVKDSNASIHTAQLKSSSRTKSTERQTIRNARGEIEWKDAPPIPSSSAHQLLSAALERLRPTTKSHLDRVPAPRQSTPGQITRR